MSKLKLSLFALVAEQAGDSTPANDPFARIPHGFERTLTGSELEKKHIVERIDAIQHALKPYNAKMTTLIQQAPGGFPGTGRDYVGKKAQRNLPAGKVSVGDYVYDLSAFHDPAARAWAEKNLPKMQNLEDKKRLEEKKMRAILKAEKDAKAAAVQSAVGASTAPTGNSTIPGSQIPLKIATQPGGGKRGEIDNPYFKSQEYAGVPSGYGFSTPMRTMYNIFQLMLKRHGLTLDTLYVGREGGPKGPINFVCMGKMGVKFIWRKYDMGGGSGQNWVYLNGYKINSSTLAGATAAQQDVLLKTHGVI